MQGARRRHYIREGDWVDSLYKTYVTVIVALVALFYLGAAFGSADASAATVRDVEAHAPAVLGLVVAVFAALGLRSGARGGPLAVAAPDVTHLLLAPIPRSIALRGTAWRQLRGVLLLPTIAGGVAAKIAANHFGGEQVLWIVAGAAFGALAALLTWGAALVASGRRWSNRRAQLVGAVLVVWAGLDLALTTGTSPTTQIGRVALGPLSWSWPALIGIVLPVRARRPGDWRPSAGLRSSRSADARAARTGASIRRHASRPAVDHRVAPGARAGTPTVATVVARRWWVAGGPLPPT